MKNKYTFLIIGAIVIFVSLLMFCTIKNKETIDYVAIVFIVIAEVSCIVGFYTSQKVSGYFTLAIIMIVALYAVVSILYSLFFKGAYVDDILKFIVTNITFMAVAAIAVIIAHAIIPGTERGEQKTFEQMALIQECEQKALILSTNEQFAVHRDILTKIYEEIKYHDKVSDYKSREILTALNKISEQEDEDARNLLCQEAMQLINERNIVVGQTKKGGF